MTGGALIIVKMKSTFILFFPVLNERYIENLQNQALLLKYEFSYLSTIKTPVNFIFGGIFIIIHYM